VEIRFLWKEDIIATVQACKGVLPARQGVAEKLTTVFLSFDP